MNNQSNFPGFRTVPMTGVIYVSTEAQKRGFYYGNPEWSNLGQGAPEVGDLSSPKIKPTISEDQSCDEYAPVPGLKALRQAVADMYNTLYRTGKSSQYTADNVAICSGGRLALTRIAASIGNCNLGHCIPDYTAYEELLTTFKLFNPIPLRLNEDYGFQITSDWIEKQITNFGLEALLFSNPCNPTGQVVQGNELKDVLDKAKSYHCSLILDEFYSHYIYDQGENYTPNSGAEHVEDVNDDPVVILDGLTKNWRLPGWRICWTLAPESIIQTISSAGSFLDGGASHPIQQSVIDLLHSETVLQKSNELRLHFEKKRDWFVSELQSLGMIVHNPPGAFYCWTDISNLPAPLNNCHNFFEAMIKQKIITVPGTFFDVNPGQRRPRSQFESYVRLSFGPEMEELQRGIKGMAKQLAAAR